MPALVLFGRRWQVGSDDFVIPGFADLLIRLAWLIAVAVVYLKNDENLNLECSEGYHIKIYLYGVFAILHLIIFFDIALVHNSKAGSILETEARKYVPFCLYFRSFFQLAEIVWTFIGTIGIANGMLLCSSRAEVGSLITALVISNWVLVLIFIFLLYLSFDPIGTFKYTLEPNEMPNPFLVKEWVRKFRSFGCFYCGPRMLKKEAFEEAGLLFASMFEDVDVVPTDAIAGITLLAWKNARAKRNKLKSIKVECNQENSSLKKPNTRGISWPTNPSLEKWNSIPVLCHLKKYAMTAYSWPLVLVGHSHAVKSLWKNSYCCGCLPGRNQPLDVDGDNCCFLNASAVKIGTQLENSDIIYVSFRNPLFETPFFVALDHPTKSIIIAIRGTLSPNDILVDLNAVPQLMNIPGLPESFKTHHGMLRCAQIVKEKLESRKLLENLFAAHPDYNLVLTGTSLGAGTATILSLILKADYPSLKCYAYAPPGGLLSLDAAQYCESFVISVIYGDDFVARLGIYSMETLKYQIMDVLNECRTSKYRILLGEIYWLCGGFPNFSFPKDPTVPKLHHGKPQLTVGSEKAKPTVIVVDSDPDKDTDDAINVITKQPVIVSSVPAIKKLVQHEELYPPGRILHITEAEFFQRGKRKTNEEPRWTIRWAHRSDFRELLITRRMIADHIPFRMYKSLHDLTEKYNDSFGCVLRPNNSPVIRNVFKKK